MQENYTKWVCLVLQLKNQMPKSKFIYLFQDLLSLYFKIDNIQFGNFMHVWYV